MWRLSRALFWLPTAVVFTEYLYTIKLVNGNSMRPTLNPDESLSRDLVLFDRLSPRIGNRYQRGEIVALKSPSEPGRMLVKRILALDGDVVKTLPPYPDAEVVIPQGHVWVEGDEPFRSDDSNQFGPVSLGLLDAKLTFILWPPSRFGSINGRSSVNSSQTSDEPTRRRERAVLERESWRKARVVVNPHV